jgi:FdhD protein
VISIAAPTDLAVKEANRYGITLIGFADSKRFNVYSHSWRLKTKEQWETLKSKILKKEL